MGNPHIADMHVRHGLAQSATYAAAALVQDPRDDDPAAAGARAKLLAGDAAIANASTAVQVLGGYGYTTDFPAERYLREAKVTQIFEGTNQIQRLVIARQLLRANSFSRGER